MNQLLTIVREKLNKQLIAGILLGFVAGALFTKLRSKTKRKVGILDLIGNTPLIYLPKLSKHAKCHIYVSRIRCRSKCRCLILLEAAKTELSNSF